MVQAHAAARIGRTISESTPRFPERPKPPTESPNIVIIVLDDLGFADLGCFGSRIATPNIDRLATGSGLRYNNFHVTAVCSSTRACVLTGRNHHAVGMGLFPQPLGFPGYTGRIPKSAGTVASVLQDSGYNTFAVGKWHITPSAEVTPAGPFDRWPLGMGFERYYGFMHGMTSQWVPDLVQDNSFVEPPQSPHDGYHLTEDLASQATRMIQDQQHAAPNKPFFLYFAPGAMHFPHHVHPGWAEPYRARFDDGWEVARKQTFDRQVEHGIVPETTCLTERPGWVPSWGDLPREERRLYSRMMEIYAGFLTHTDAQIGRLIDFIDTIGALDNTLVMVMSDNGASPDGGPHGMLSFACNDLSSMIRRIDDFGGFRGVQNHYAWGWAWAGNTPFRLWKHYSWLGGVRVPLIVHWPKHLSNADVAPVRSQFCHAIDLMPTVLEATGVSVPDVLGGVPQQPLDGESLLPTFTDPDCSSPRTIQYFETSGSRAIYWDGWKATTDHVLAPQKATPANRSLIEGSDDFDNDRWMLFDLTDDFAEARDRADEESDRLRMMEQLWWAEAGRNHVLPLMDDVPGRASDRGSTPVVEPPLYPQRDKYVLLPGAGPVTTPSPFVAGFTVDAEVDVTETHASGIICSQRGSVPGWNWSGAWACYLLDGRLIVAFDFDGPCGKVVTADLVQPGRRELRIVFRPPLEGKPESVTIDIDGQVQETSDEMNGLSAVIEQARVGSAGARLAIGRGDGFPVSNDYLHPFEFSGEIHRVTFTVPDVASHGGGGDIAAAAKLD